VEIPSAGTYAPSPVMVTVHAGDFYDPVVRYRALMGDLGVPTVSHFEPNDYAAAWCTWGYQRTFTVQDIPPKMSQMKAMGMKELILDDGWFDRFGDWNPTRKKFPRGDSDMKALIDKAHTEGLTFRLWWSRDRRTRGPRSTGDIPTGSFWPRTGTGRRLVGIPTTSARLIGPWRRPCGPGGTLRQAVGGGQFQLDGTDLNHAPLCYNPAHHHTRPEESFEQWPELFRQIRATAMAIRPDFRIELCPVGSRPLSNSAPLSSNR